jgi:uncharacterized cupin superfamily protein
VPFRNGVEEESMTTLAQVRRTAIDVASFPKGTRSVWTIVERVEKFTVVSRARRGT